MKTCSKCKVEKPLSDFYLKSGGGHRHLCKKCHCQQSNNSEARKAYVKLPHVRAKYSARNREKTTGISAENFKLLFDLAGGKCSICSKPMAIAPAKSAGLKAFADHDHITGKPRGVICNRCNSGLGFFDDSIESLKSAIAYLENPPLGLL